MESEFYTIDGIWSQDGVAFTINPGYHIYKVSDVAGDGALEESIISYDDILIKKLGGVCLAHDWKMGQLT